MIWVGVINIVAAGHVTPMRLMFLHQSLAGLIADNCIIQIDTIVVSEYDYAISPNNLHRYS